MRGQWEGQLIAGPAKHDVVTGPGFSVLAQVQHQTVLYACDSRAARLAGTHAICSLPACCRRSHIK
jgi:hypothetical protein